MKYIIFILAVFAAWFLILVKLDSFAICLSVLYAALILTYKGENDD